MGKSGRLLIIFLLLVSWAAIASDELYFIDTHSQADHGVDDLGLIIERMNIYGQHMDLWRGVLMDLPEETAHAIAHGNAERLWYLH